MAKKEITTLEKKEIAINFAAITTNTTTTGGAISTAGFNGGINIDFILGVRTDGTYTPLITESDTSGGSYTAVADEFLVKQDTSSSTAPEAQAVLTASNTNSKIGYVGTKPFIKAAIISTSVTSGVATAGALVSKLSDVAPVV
jgi:hypothetical protein